MRKAVFVLLLVMGSLVGYGQGGAYVIVSVGANSAKQIAVTISYGDTTETIAVTSDNPNPYYTDAALVNEKLVAVFNKLSKEGYSLINSNSSVYPMPTNSSSYAVTTTSQITRANYVFYKQ